MLKIEIYEDSESSGEHCWKCRVETENEKTVFCTTQHLKKGEILAFAKFIKNKCADAPVFDKKPEDSDQQIWFEYYQDENKQWCLDLQIPNYKETIRIANELASENAIKEMIESIKKPLCDADIVWNPPEADPAQSEKDSDSTKTQGIAGS